MAPMDAIWLYSVQMHTTFWLSTHPTALPIYRSASGIGYVNKNNLKSVKWRAIKIAIISTQYLVNREIMNSYRIVANFIQACVFLFELQYLKMVFQNIYNCAWKLGFLKCSHILYKNKSY